MDWDSAYIEGLIRAALTEDLGPGDVTVAATVSPSQAASARIVTTRELVCAGLPLAEKLFRRLDPEISVKAKASEGQRVPSGTCLVELNGNAAAILSGKQTVLNFLSHLCGIATHTRMYVDAVSGPGAKIRDSRNTTSGLRRLEQYAVNAGGGSNYRAGLFDAIVLTREHIAAAGGTKAALDQAHSHASRLMNPLPLTAYEATGTVPSETDAGSLPVQIGVQNEAQLREALSAGAESILFEDMAAAQLREFTEIARSIRGDCVLEISGEISLKDATEYAVTGVDYIAPRELIRSAPPAELRLLVDAWQ